MANITARRFHARPEARPLTAEESFFLGWARALDDAALFARWRALRQRDWPTCALALRFAVDERCGVLDSAVLEARAASGCPFSRAALSAPETERPRRAAP